MKIVSIYFLLGIVAGITYGLIKSIVFVFKKNIVVQIIGDFTFVLTLGISFIVLNHYFFYGEFRFYLLASLLLGLYIELKTIGKIFAKLFLLLYNKLSKGIELFKSTRFGKVLFK